VRLLAGSWLTLAFIAAVALMLWSALGLSRVSGWIPLSVLSATCMLLIWQLVSEALAARRAPHAPARPEAAVRDRRALAAMAWIGLLLLLSWLLGVVAGSALFCAAWLRWHARASWTASLAQAAGLGFVLWLAFAQLLGAGLYAGLLGQLFR
jgi:MFS superfamily sulfate permease-like transporter